MEFSAFDILGERMLPEEYWLSTICIIPTDRSDGYDQELDWICRLVGFAVATDTITLARIRNPFTLAYEILFIFNNFERRTEFLELVEADGFASPCTVGTFIAPSEEAIWHSRPLNQVFPKQQAEIILGCRCYRNMYGGN